jgi:hypothetical protein
VLTEQVFRSPVWTKLPNLRWSPIGDGHHPNEVSIIMTVFLGIKEEIIERK